MKRISWRSLGMVIGFTMLFGCDKALEAIENGEDDMMAREMARAEKHVIADFEKQYEIVARSGDAMERYVQTGLVAAAYLQAKDEDNYAKWKAKEKEDCAEAGMPDM